MKLNDQVSVSRARRGRGTGGHASRHACAALARRSRSSSFLLFLGPAVVASIAYVDPGNYATNIQAGSRYGFALLWVVVLANLIAMLFQALSARLGIATGKSLAEVSRDQLPRSVVLTMWVIAEISAMATDLAEFLGGAIGLSLLFRIPLMWCLLITACITYALLVLGGRSARRLELGISFFVLLIGGCYLIELVIAPVDWSAAARGLVTPSMPDEYAVVVAVGILGATIMPHAIFLHSDLTAKRSCRVASAERRQLLHYSNIEVLGALCVAGLVNIAMIIMAAAAFHHGHTDVAGIENAYYLLFPLLGGLAASVFLVSLLASGISSSVVGTMAGQVIMQGFVHRRIPIWLRRVVTMAPAFIVVASGVDVTDALVLSQVVLSITLPVPVFSLLWFVSKRAIMGEFTIGWPLRAVSGAGAAIVVILNVMLVVAALGFPLPGVGE